LSKWRKLLAEKGEAADSAKFTAHVKDNHFIPNTVIIDCTASAKVADNYFQWLSKGIHIITPNKRANSGPFDQVNLLIGLCYWSRSPSSHLL
jgi:aspartokinase/homoserine dehydrogenase 1